MVNFELLGGVNFKKGCYPGQEIVARSQYWASSSAAPRSSASPMRPPWPAANCLPSRSRAALRHGRQRRAQRVGGIDALVEMKLGAIAEGGRGRRRRRSAQGAA
jgi:hypothetical protein